MKDISKRLGCSVSTFLLISLIASLMTLPARAGDWPPPLDGPCGDAMYGNEKSIGGGDFGARMDHVNKRLQALCTETSRKLQQNIQQAVSTCQLGNEVGNQARDRWLNLCDGAKKAMQDAYNFCRNYDQVGLEVAGRANQQVQKLGSGNQKNDVSETANITDTAASTNKMISADAEAAKTRIIKDAQLPDAKSGAASAPDKTLSNLASRAKGLAGSNPQGCQNLAKVADAAANIAKNNLFPNIRVLVDGLGAVSTKAQAQATKFVNVTNDLNAKAANLGAVTSEQASVPGGAASQAPTPSVIPVATPRRNDSDSPLSSPSGRDLFSGDLNI